MDQVEVAGLRIAFERAGRGAPLVLVHGAVCDGRVWRRQLDDLSDEFTVIAWDAPGCGRSADPPESFRLPDYADALAGFIAALDLGRPHVLGHSFGGGLALELYRRHPAVPATLILVGAYAGWAGSLPGSEVERRLRFALDVADRLPGGFEPTSMPGLFSKTMSPEAVDELAAIMSEIRPVATRAMAHALAEADLREVLPVIDVPTLLLYGDADERSPLNVAEDLRDSIPTSRLVVMAGLGHVSYLESPERFDAEVRSFLRSPA
ncbi:MAG TPA: alpha/beta hydrolase [Gaiellaceae bacterium]|nr:alpha/beta hydrolase [Gaiellaceae bacterium]